MLNQIVVAGAIVRGCTVLVAQRVRPPELAGRWELPGGKVAAGETERAALAGSSPKNWDSRSPTSRWATVWATILR